MTTTTCTLPIKRNYNATAAVSAEAVAEDVQRLLFLDRLKAQMHRPILWHALTDWEISFVKDLVESTRPLEDKQRKTIDDLKTRFPKI